MTAKNKQRQKQVQQQVPCGNGRKNSNSKYNSRFPSGMTARKAKAKALQER
jgi:hypothetical protein